jgi:hypothetical protein
MKELARQIRVVPKSVANAAAEILQSVPASLAKRNAAFAKFGDASQMPAAYDRGVRLGLDYDADATTNKLMATVDLATLVDGGLIMAGAVDRASNTLRRVDKKADFTFDWTTPIGKISLHGCRDDVYPKGSYLLIIDTAGNNRYESAGASDAQTPISVAIDVSGNAVYDSHDGASFGTGITGYGFLLNMGGHATYTVSNVGMGVGAFGVGMLMDRGGSSVYTARRFSQGAAAFGIGVLNDVKGSDKYSIYSLGEGYGATQGCGMVVNGGGNNFYDANDTDLAYASPQTAQHNTTLGQGFGFGNRDSLAGGVGMLVNAQGNNSYHCGVFGQGAGYWYGLGILVDLAGNDSYNGVWYTQGAAAHHAIGTLVNASGKNHYIASMNQSLGHGRDFSIGSFHSFGGYSTFECPGEALGSANAHGIGVFRDDTGHNTYKAGTGAFGYVEGWWAGYTLLGLFYDGGSSVFPAGSRAKDNSAWTMPGVPKPSQIQGVGVAGH